MAHSDLPESLEELLLPQLRELLALVELMDVLVDVSKVLLASAQDVILVGMLMRMREAAVARKRMELRSNSLIGIWKNYQGF